MMSFLNYTTKNTAFVLIGIIFLSFLSSCGGIGNIWDPADARKVPAYVNERVHKNLEEAKKELKNINSKARSTFI